MSQGIIFNIQKFSIHDGPGIRTTVFLKGCPLRCDWCSNPESQIHNTQILYDKTNCTLCKQCINICPKDAISKRDNIIFVDHDKCIGCNQCVNTCPTKALSIEGEYKEIDEIVRICKQDIDFYEESNGGITISGGEGMSQPAFLNALVSKLKEEKLHLAIETTGCVDPLTFQQLAPLFDLLLFDVKHYDSDSHLQATGVPNELILENLAWALKQELNILPRIAVIPDFNNGLEDAKQFSLLFKKLNITKVQLLPFHQFGEKKYSLLNREYKMKNKKALYPEDLIEYRQIFLDEGIECFF